MVKYYCNYSDVENVSHRFEIYDDDYSDAPIPINGYVILQYADVDSPLEVIRGQGLKIILDADVTLTFNDLWSGEERKYKVIYYRNNETLFTGWLLTEGFFEDFVSDKWQVTLVCSDGLGYLKDLAFVQSNGLPYLSKMSMLDVLRNALSRTGIEQELYTKIDIFYTGLSDTVNVLENTYINTQRYVKDDGETIMSCDEVIRDILEPFTAILTNRKGVWIVCRPLELSASNMTFFRYNSEGIYLGTATINLLATIGSHINGFYPHHVNANQRIENVASLGAHRINYKYGLVNGLSDNVYLQGDGTSIDGYTIVNTTFTNIPTTNLGINLELNPGGATPNVILMRSDTVSVLESILISAKFKFTTYEEVTGIVISIKLVSGGTTYYYSILNEWITTETVWKLPNFIYNPNYDGPPDPLRIGSEISKTFELQFSIPSDGDLSFEFWQPTNDNNTTLGNGYAFLEQVEFSIEDNNRLPIKGEFHTFQRTTNPTAKVKDVQVVYTGDNPLDVYKGTIYKSDADTPTLTWYRKGYADNLPLIGIMGNEIMKLAQKSQRMFAGDVYGYFDYLSFIQINGFTNKFVVYSYLYDTKQNVISAVFHEVFTDELSDVDYEVTYDYGETVKPTIVG